MTLSHPELDFEYFITKNFSTELVLALSKHDIMGNNGGTNLGSVWLLPPSLFVKYHPIPDYIVSPYVGFGMNVVFPFDEKLAADPNFKIHSSVGWAAKVGADVRITDSVYWNIDAMYYDCQPDMFVAGGEHKLNSTLSSSEPVLAFVSRQGSITPALFDRKAPCTISRGLFLFNDTHRSRTKNIRCVSQSSTARTLG